MKKLHVHYVSDLHIDFHIKEINISEKLTKLTEKFIKSLGVDNIPENERDVLVVAGDLGHYFSQIKEFLLQCKTLFKHVIIIAGNHDHYLCSKMQMKKYLANSNNRISELKVFCLENDVIFLDKSYVVIEGYRIAGTMGYWDYSFLTKLDKKYSEYEINDAYLQKFNDMVYMMYGQEPYKIPLAYGAYITKCSWDVYDFRQDQLHKLDSVVNDLNGLELDLMITHYCPTLELKLPKQYKQDVNTVYYISDYSKYQEILKPKFWVFGHVHHYQDFINNGTNYLCNPLGYPSEGKLTKLKSFVLEPNIKSKEII